jgi:hypothetical protein
MVGNRLIRPEKLQEIFEDIKEASDGVAQLDG